MPFGREELEYIAQLDARADVELLRRELPSLRPDCLRLLEVTTTLLQKAAAAGLSLAEVAAVATRPIIGESRALAWHAHLPAAAWPAGLVRASGARRYKHIHLR